LPRDPPPTNLADAMDRAQLYQDRNEDLHGRFCRESKVLILETNNQVPLQLVPVGKSQLPIKWLPPTEWRENRDIGLCFSYDEKFHSNHRCKNRMMVMCDHEEEQESNKTQNLSDIIEEEELKVEKC